MRWCSQCHAAGTPITAAAVAQARWNASSSSSSCCCSCLRRRRRRSSGHCSRELIPLCSCYCHSLCRRSSSSAAAAVAGTSDAAPATANAVAAAKVAEAAEAAIRRRRLCSAAAAAHSPLCADADVTQWRLLALLHASSRFTMHAASRAQGLRRDAGKPCILLGIQLCFSLRFL